MEKRCCANCGQAAVDGSTLCYDCLAGWSRPTKGGDKMANLDQEILISALRHECISKDVIIQRNLFLLAEKEDKIIELQDRLERFLDETGFENR